MYKGILNSTDYRFDNKIIYDLEKELDELKQKVIDSGNQQTELDIEQKITDDDRYFAGDSVYKMIDSSNKNINVNNIDIYDKGIYEKISTGEVNKSNNYYNNFIYFIHSFVNFMIVIFMAYIISRYLKTYNKKNSDIIKWKF
jgi:hypothetical protein